MGVWSPNKLSVWFDKFTFWHETMSHHQYFGRNEVYSTFENSEINGNEIKTKKDWLADEQSNVWILKNPYRLKFRSYRKMWDVMEKNGYFISYISTIHRDQTGYDFPFCLTSVQSREFHIQWPISVFALCHFIC